jgi:hypothetical protein
MTILQRREFIAGLGGAAAWPLAVRAQRPLVRMPRIGIIDDEPLFDNFRQGLRDLGYVGTRTLLSNADTGLRKARSIDSLKRHANSPRFPLM